MINVQHNDILKIRHGSNELRCGKTAFNQTGSVNKGNATPFHTGMLSLNINIRPTLDTRVLKN